MLLVGDVFVDIEDETIIEYLIELVISEHILVGCVEALVHHGAGRCS